MIIGQPKTVDDLDPFSLKTIAEFEAGMNGQLSQGMPLEIPVAMPFGQMCQMARTVKAYKAVAEKLCALELVDESFVALQEEAKTLLETPEPAPAPAVQPAQGRVILPK